MFRDSLELATTDIHNFVLNHGALGDVITSLPAIVRARQTHHESMIMRVWVPPWQQELITALLSPYGPFEIKDVSQFPMKRVERQGWDGGAVSCNAMAYNTHTRNRVHMVDYAFNCLTDSQPENMMERSYPTAAPLGHKWIQRKYVVIPVGATSDNKLFRASVMEPVIKWLQEQDYLVVFTGTRKSYTKALTASGEVQDIVIRDQVELLSPDVYAKCKDMRESTPLIALRDICGYAEAVIGVDGGTLHVAGTTDTNIIYAMGTTHPRHRYIPRFGSHEHKIRYVVPRDLECTGCQSNWTMTSHDFRFCAYGDNKCMEMLSSEDFINGFKELVGK
jgi:ADP-heptose:LPS heptosyltransferase